MYSRNAYLLLGSRRGQSSGKWSQSYLTWARKGTGTYHTSADVAVKRTDPKLQKRYPFPESETCKHCQESASNDLQELIAFARLVTGWSHKLTPQLKHFYDPIAASTSAPTS